MYWTRRSAVQRSGSAEELQQLRHNLSRLEAELFETQDNQEHILQQYFVLCDESKDLKQALGDTKQALEEVQVGRGQLQKGYQELQRAWKDARDEAEKARAELTLYKSRLASSSQVETQVTDDEIGSKMDQIFYAIQDFAVTASRGSHFGQSLFHSRTYQISATYLGMFKNGWQYAYREAAIYPNGLDHADVAMTKAWLEPTRKLIAKVDEEAFEKANEALPDELNREIEHILGPCFGGRWHASAASKIQKITTSALGLFDVLHRSKATFEIRFVPSEAMASSDGFKPEAMQAIASAQEDGELAGTPLCMVVFPAVIKFGDEMGEHRDQKTVICKARVITR
ncbi:hypothetical protein LTR53_002159 [Teratosphaeriaceae sp. CCFEE 6253]|nr:hypothetical protein LTR53_002159 [Teratosphaeriaceae sp. CCFEE 6253]